MAFDVSEPTSANFRRSADQLAARVHPVLQGCRIGTGADAAVGAGPQRQMNRGGTVRSAAASPGRETAERGDREHERASAASRAGARKAVSLHTSQYRATGPVVATTETSSSGSKWLLLTGFSS